MTRLKIRDYEPQDFLDIEVSEQEKEFRVGMPLAQWAWIHKHTGPCYTLLAPDGQIVACVGIHNLWPGVGELWLTLSTLAQGYPYTWVALRKLLDGVKNWYVRIQATSDPQWAPTRKFNEHYGFCRESRLRCYGPRGEDHLLYAWVKESA